MKQTYGFTLIELSIVLVIVGLVVSGVVVGGSMVEQAKLRSLITQSDKFKVAYDTFLLKYDNARPGDMVDAHDYWGTDCAADADDCNGNGDGLIWLGDDTFPDSLEFLRAWQHLSLAKLVEGSYDGVGVDGGSGAAVSNSPGGIMDGLFAVFTFTDYNAHRLSFGKLRTTAGANQGKPYNGIFLPSEVYQIDIKIDDGIPASGRFSGRKAKNYPSDDCYSGALYLVNTELYNCFVYWVLF